MIKKSQSLYLKIFLEVKFSIYLNRRAFIMVAFLHSVNEQMQLNRVWFYSYINCDIFASNGSHILEFYGFL